MSPVINYRQRSRIDSVSFSIIQIKKLAKNYSNLFFFVCFKCAYLKHLFATGTIFIFSDFYHLFGVSKGSRVRTNLKLEVVLAHLLKVGTLLYFVTTIPVTLHKAGLF